MLSLSVPLPLPQSASRHVNQTYFIPVGKCKTLTTLYIIFIIEFKPVDCSSEKFILFPLKQCRYATHCKKYILFKPAFALQLKPESKPFLQSFLLLDFIPQVDSANTIFNCKFTGCVLDCGTEQEKKVPSFYLVS